MKALMVYPDIESEKAIANYSINLVGSINKNGQQMDSITYTAGKPLTIFRKLKKIKSYDLIHIQHEYNLLGWFGLPFFFVLFYLLLSGKKVVVTMHTVLSQKEKFKNGPLKRFLRKMLYQLQNRFIRISSDAVIVHAQMFKDILIKEYGFKENKIYILPQAIIDNLPKISREKARKELHLSGKVYLLIGSFVPDHGADLIVSQADKIGKTILIATNPDAVNDRNKERISNFLAKVKGIVAENKFEELVRFDLGKIPFELWWKYFAASDLVLLPYQGGIASGIYADAISMKIPIVASNIPFFDEAIRKYKFLRIAKDGDYASEIKKAMDKKNYNLMKKSFDVYINQFGISVIGKKYKAIYDSI